MKQQKEENLEKLHPLPQWEAQLLQQLGDVVGGIWENWAEKEEEMGETWFVRFVELSQAGRDKALKSQYNFPWKFEIRKNRQ